MALLERQQVRLRRRWPKGEAWVAAAMIAPAALVIFLVVGVPLLRAFWMSLFNIVLIHPDYQPFVGPPNYVRQLTSPDFWAAAQRSLVFTVASTGVELFLGLGIALLMNQPLRLRWVLRGLVTVSYTHLRAHETR